MTEEINGVQYPQDYYLEQVYLISASGDTVELRKLVRELSIFEDIFSFVVSGYVKIEDAIGIIDGYNLTGNEYIRISFGKTKDDPDMHYKTYRIYKMGDRVPSGNQMSEFYTLYFCTDELLVSEQLKISKSYNSTQINDIINDILMEQMQIPEQRIVKVEDTMGIYDFVIPRYKPFEAISWLSNYARPSVGKGADMLFFETKDGFNFRSLQSMYKQAPFAQFLYQQKNLPDNEEDFDKKTRTIITFEYGKAFDNMENISQGAFASKLISLDPLQRKKTVTTFNAKKYEADTESTTMGEYSSVSDLKNRFGKTLTNSYDSSFKLVTGNSKQYQDPYISETEAASKDIFIEDFVPNRAAQLNLAMRTNMKIVVPGRPGLMAGQVVEVQLPSTMQKDEGGTDVREGDKYYSGRYLVTAVRHIIQPENVAYQTILELSRGNSEEPPTAVDNTDTIMKDYISGTSDTTDSVDDGTAVA